MSIGHCQNCKAIFINAKGLYGKSQTPLVQWLALWSRDPQVAVSNPVGDGQGYELLGEIAHTD